MNSNTLRIRGSNSTTRMSTTFDPVSISESYKTFLRENGIFKEFLEENSETQLSRLKEILFGVKGNFNYDSVKFLVIVYLQADVKHPAKCMISRFVSKNNFIQKQFEEILTKEVDSLIDEPCMDYKSYIYVVTKVTSCTENFPTGAAAVKNLELKLAKYFKDCLNCCVATLRDVKPIAPTEKNEIFSLAHSTLRIILYILQKISEEHRKMLISLFDEIRRNLKFLMFDGDTPMDTKSVCGILYVSMYIMERTPDSWIDILLSGHINDSFKDLFSDESAKLCIYSALVTAVPMEKLKEELPDGERAIDNITNNILDIGDRCSADAHITLSAWRALAAAARGGPAGGLAGALWPALEHRADAVQHLGALALRQLVRHADHRRRNGDEKPMRDLVSKLVHLDRERKSFYVGLGALAGVLGARCVLREFPGAVAECIAALHVQAVQASATTALEMLLQNHIQTSSSDVIFEQWIKPILAHVNNDVIDSAVMNILESLLGLALKLDSDLVDYFSSLVGGEEGGEEGEEEVQAGRLVAARALRRAGRGGALAPSLLRRAAVHCAPENRILCISLIVDSPKTTEVFAKSDLDLVLWFLRYNINAQEPHFRQQVLSIMKKFTKRLESSYKALIRDNDPEANGDNGQYYLTFIEQLRGFCFASLLRGANYSRRHVALQLLVWMEEMAIDGYIRTWNDHQIETLLYHLGDSYEGNKALALELLCHCPADMLKSKKYSTSLDLKDILAEASSVKPTDCVTAVYKLKLLRSVLPEYIVQGSDSKVPNKVKFALLSILLEEFEKQLLLCQQSIVLGARSAPMYGLLHCIGHSVETVSPYGIPPEQLTQTIQRLVERCADVWSCTSTVLCSAAPEGHLPTRGDSGSIPLEDGKEVTAQMVLLCAWRSIKEVSLVLGKLVTQALLHEEFQPASLRSCLLRRVGELFRSLLMQTKHRGAFEQVYVGYTSMLTSLWRSRNPEFNELPKQWLEELLRVVERGDPDGRLCATRRSAGLPFMIQALVITELQVKCNPRSFDECVTRLLRLAGGGSGSGAESGVGSGADSGTGSGVGSSVGSGAGSGAGMRCHALNTVRALVRDRALHERVAPHVADALLLALRGFERDTWIERNSATLLFSALMVRIFGVQRGKDAEQLCVRNRMTGRIFFLKYPKLYDFMLEKLKELSEDKDETLLRPSLYPVLLLLARLYPSSLEGTVSNLKLSSFVPLLRGCARTAGLTARRLAARAAPALLLRERYVSHIEEMFELLTDRDIKRNYCHGILLQLIKLLEAKPEKLVIDKSQSRLLQLAEQARWVLRSSGAAPCYLIADEYVKMINVLIWRFDELLEKDFINNIQKDLQELIFGGSNFRINPGKELCLANAAYLNLIIAHKYDRMDDIPQFVYDCLAHKHYEVILTALNYLLIQNRVFEVENNFQKHLQEISKDLDLFEDDPRYIENLCEVLKNIKYLECKQKCLKLLTLKDNTAKDIIKAKTRTNYEISDDAVVDRLLYYIDNEHENLMHYYLSSLCNFLYNKMAEGTVSERKLLEAMRVIFSCVLPNNNDETRAAVVEFLEKSLSWIQGLLESGLKILSEEDQFELRCLTWSCAVSALHDDDAALRARLARAHAAPHAAPHARAVLHTRAAHALLQTLAAEAAAAPLLALLALLDFRLEVCASDDLDQESRVFDENEKYNIYLEETIWTRDCARKLIEICHEENLCEYLYNIINMEKYRRTFEKMCGDHIVMFEKSIKGYKNNINAKVEIFIDTLKTNYEGSKDHFL